MCVHPWTKGFPPLLLPQFFNHLVQPPSTGRGVEQACRAPLNKALCSVLRISARTLADVPARSFTSCYTTLPRFVSWSFMFPPPKPFPPQQRCSLSLFVTAVKGNSHCSNTYNFFSDFSPCRSITFLLNVVIELTEYKCQSVFRSAVPLGC